jgi:hypothetical protein
VEEELFMKSRKNWLNITSAQKRGMKQENPCLRCRPKVRGLAHLTSRFVLSVAVGVDPDLSNKNNKQNRQTKCK